MRERDSNRQNTRKKISLSLSLVGEIFKKVNGEDRERERKPKPPPGPRENAKFKERERVREEERILGALFLLSSRDPSFFNNRAVLYRVFVRALFTLFLLLKKKRVVFGRKNSSLLERKVR